MKLSEYFAGMKYLCWYFIVAFQILLVLYGCSQAGAMLSASDDFQVVLGYGLITLIGGLVFWNIWVFTRK